jgi:hypothetical protein
VPTIRRAFALRCEKRYGSLEIIAHISLRNRNRICRDDSHGNRNIPRFVGGRRWSAGSSASIDYSSHQLRSKQGGDVRTNCCDCINCLVHHLRRDLPKAWTAAIACTASLRRDSAFCKRRLDKSPRVLDIGIRSVYEINRPSDFVLVATDQSSRDLPKGRSVRVKSAS